MWLHWLRGATTPVSNVVQPGRGLNIDPATLNAGAVAQYATAAHESSITGFLTGIIPKKDWIEFSHLLITHGRRVCNARKPNCEECFLIDLCPFGSGV